MKPGKQTVIENCFIALYAIPHSVANPFYLWCGRPWYTCLELVEITFGKKERETANLEGPLAWQVLSLFFSPPPNLTLSPVLSLSLSRGFSSIFPVIGRISPEAESTTVLMLLQAEGGHKLWVSCLWHSSSWASSCWKVFCLQVHSERQDLRTWQMKVVGKRAWGCSMAAWVKIGTLHVETFQVKKKKIIDNYTLYLLQYLYI